MTDYARLKHDFDELAGNIDTLKRIGTQLDATDTAAFPEDAASLRAVLHSPDKVDQAAALLIQLEGKVRAHDRAEREQQEERKQDAERQRQEGERKREAERGRQSKIIRIRATLTGAETSLNHVINSPRDVDMAEAAKEALHTVQWLKSVLEMPYTDLDSMQANAEQLSQVASMLAQEQRRRDDRGHRSAGGSNERRDSAGPSGDREEGRAKSSDSRGYYAVLGVKPDAPAEEIRKAYRVMIQQYHPDLFAHEDHEWVRQEAAETTRKLNEAWGVLGDPATRRDYDRS